MMDLPDDYFTEEDEIARQQADDDAYISWMYAVDEWIAQQEPDWSKAPINLSYQQASWFTIDVDGQPKWHWKEPTFDESLNKWFVEPRGADTYGLFLESIELPPDIDPRWCIWQRPEPTP